jgi:hypothetical protein
MRHLYLPVVVLLLGVALLPVGTAAADIAVPTAQIDETPDGPEPEEDDSEDEEDDGGDTIIDIDLDPIEDAIDDLSDNIVEKIQNAVFGPFEALAAVLVDILTHLFTSYPQIQPNDAVQDVHRLTLIATFSLGTLTVILAGLLFQVGPLFGVSYRQVRMLLLRVLLALVFGTVSPFLLQYAVELADALTLAFKPENPGFISTVRLTGGLAIVSVLNAFLLVAVAALFVVRDFYLLFAAAASPLIALGWALPYTRRFASSLIGVFWGFLLIGPLDMIAFHLILELLATGGETPAWLTALGGFVMLLYMPYIVLTAGQGMAVELGMMAANANPMRLTGRYRRMRHQQDGEEYRQKMRDRRRQRALRQYGGNSRGSGRRANGRGVSDGNKFRDDLPEDYDQ